MKQRSTSVPIYDSAAHRFLAWDELCEVIRYRDLIFHLIHRDVTVRYKRSILGIGWTMLNPLGMMLVLTIVFSQVFHTIEGYAAYVLNGLIIWNFFAQTSAAVINALVWGGDLFKRIYLPRSTFALSAIGTGLVNLLFALIPILIVMVIQGIPIRPTVLLAPIAALPMACFSLGIGLLVSTIGIYFRDVVEMYQVLLAAWFYATPILYPPEQLPEGIRTILRFNPTLYLVQIFRKPLYGGEVPLPAEWAIAFAVGFMVLTLGWIIFTGKADEFAYRA